MRIRSKLFRNEDSDLDACMICTPWAGCISHAGRYAQCTMQQYTPGYAQAFRVTNGADKGE